MRSALLTTALLGSLGCGAAPTGGASTATTGAPASGERCLANAEAKHERKPNEPFRIEAKHILVRFAGARNAPPNVTRTREQACLRTEEALAQLKRGKPFAEVVAAYSDESGGPARDGSLGSVQRGDVAPAFADAAFELQVGEVSDVVETPFGFHLILRVE